MLSQMIERIKKHCAAEFRYRPVLAGSALLGAVRLWDLAKTSHRFMVSRSRPDD